jgi:hypothetical protein
MGPMSCQVGAGHPLHAVSALHVACCPVPSCWLTASVVLAVWRVQSMRRHKLVAAQPSNCRGNDSDNPYW